MVQLAICSVSLSTSIIGNYLGLTTCSVGQHYETLVTEGRWAELEAVLDGEANTRGRPQCSKKSSAIKHHLESMELAEVLDKALMDVSVTSDAMLLPILRRFVLRRFPYFDCADIRHVRLG